MRAGVSLMPGYACQVIPSRSIEIQPRGNWTLRMHILLHQKTSWRLLHLIISIQSRAPLEDERDNPNRKDREGQQSKMKMPSLHSMQSNLQSHTNRRPGGAFSTETSASNCHQILSNKMH